LSDEKAPLVPTEAKRLSAFAHLHVGLLWIRFFWNS